MLDPQPTWTQERLDLLKSAFDAGLSCREIGDQIGVSRNAVIGKLSRLQWKREKMIAGPKRRAVARTSHRRTGLRLRRQFLRSVEIHEAPIQSMHTCSLFELSAHTCRWPVSSPGEGTSRSAAARRWRACPIVLAIAGSPTGSVRAD